MEPLDEVTAALTIRDYCCSACWGHLVKRPTENRLYIVECHSCGTDTPGYVTKAYADRRRAESFNEAYEVKKLLKGLGILPTTKRSEQDILADLGF